MEWKAALDNNLTHTTLKTFNTNTARYAQQFLATSIHVHNMFPRMTSNRTTLTTASFVAKPAAVSEWYSLSILTHCDGSL